MPCGSTARFGSTRGSCTRSTVPSVAGGRALARGRVFSRDGALVASVVQEGLSQIAATDSALGGSPMT